MVGVLAGSLGWAAASTRRSCALGPLARLAPTQAGGLALGDPPPGYARPESSTYLTFPEWYIVYSAQEYAHALAGAPPSHFPYFGAVAQYWCGYNYVYDATRGRYPFNAGDHLMLVVIGVSFSAEYGLKGVYEQSVGRAFEWLGSDQSAEDAYARRVAREYGEFLYRVPWYRFPFGQKLAGLWREIPLWGPHPLRKWERRLALSVEYAGKAAYGWAIGAATAAAYSPEDDQVMLWVANLPPDVAQREPRVHVVQQVDANSLVIAAPRYDEFRQVVTRLAQRGTRFIEIAGNREILLTALAPRAWEYRLDEGQFLFSLPVLTQSDAKRIAVRALVQHLGAVLAGLEAQGVTVEHLYDY